MVYQREITPWQLTTVKFDISRFRKTSLSFYQIIPYRVSPEENNLLLAPPHGWEEKIHFSAGLILALESCV